ncbi:MAG: DUF1565 domain-containing protein [Verrucomicrobia bacterium]|nr:DUF1565 domain-containing protein [Verrucomicrobiota bacterium]
MEPSLYGKQSVCPTKGHGLFAGIVGHANRLLLFILLLLITCTAYVNAGDYYVARQGNDNNPGTEAKPWKSIQKAADTLIAGDTAFIGKGSYSDEKSAPEI